MYTRPVKFETTDNYGSQPVGDDDVYTVKEFIQNVKEGCFIDDDGFGYPVKDKFACEDNKIYPSIVNQIPDDATHIIWFNR